MIAPLLRPLLIAIGLLACLASLALAQVEPKRSPFGVGPAPADRGLTAGRPPAGAEGPSAQAANAGPLDRAWAWAVEQQRWFNREIAGAVKQMRTEPFGPAFLSLAFLSFAYGVLHAAGPGHGKFVISSYALATGETVRRGILMSFLAALFQALSAIMIFLLLALVLRATKQSFDQAEAWLESLSWGLVALAGAYLLYTQVRPLLARRRSARAAAAGHSHAAHADAHQHGHDHRHGHDHGHDHHHGQAHGHHASHARPHAHTHDHHDHRARDHDHAHGDDCGCGHAHLPTPDQLQGRWSWGRAIALAASVGVRPCSGALVVLAFALFNGILWAGILATLAMALGTAITVASLAAMAVGARDLAVRLGGSGGPWATRAMSAAGIVGATAVLAMGTAFFIASLRGIGPI